MEELYNKVIEAYKSGDENAMTAAARNWMEVDGENPFPADSEASNKYFNAARAYRIWKSGAINSRVSKQRMTRLVREIAELNLPNPYEKPKTKTTKKVKQEHILGVLPEEVKPIEELKQEEYKEEIIKEPAEVIKEPEENKKGFFSKRKKR